MKKYNNVDWELLRDLIQDARQFFGERVETPENTTVKNAKENMQKVLAFLENRPESEQVKITLHIEQAI